MNIVMKGGGVLVSQSKRLCLHMATHRVQTRMNIQCVIGFRVPDRNDGTIEDVRPIFFFFTSELHLDYITIVHVGSWILLKTRKDHKMKCNMRWAFRKKLRCYEL